MLTRDEAHQQARDLVSSGDLNRAIVIVTTPRRLAMLNVTLLDYTTLLIKHGGAETTVRILREIQSDVQKVVTQILQQQYPPS